MSVDTGCTLNSTGGRWILFATILASASAFLAGGAVPVALPAIQANFGTTLNGLQWVVNANLLSLSALILIGGAMGDHFGRKRIFILGMAIFGASSFFSGLSPSLGMLLGLQALQGAGAALMIPQSLAIINDCFIEAERGRAIGLWAGISGGIAALGPLAGGWIVDQFSWNAVFFLVVPLSTASVIITLLFVPVTRSEKGLRLDWPGAILILVGLSGLVYGLMTAPGMGWKSPVIVASLSVGICTTVFFIFFEMRQRQPLVFLDIFKNPLVTGANIVTLLVYFGLNGVIFFAVLNLQQVQNYSPTEAGLALLPPIILITFLTWPAGAIADKIGPRLQMIIGPIIVSAGMALLLTGGTKSNYWLHFLPGLSIFGVGMATIIPPLTKCALSVEPKFSGSASGINNGMARIAGLLAVAILGAAVITTFRSHLGITLLNSSLSNQQQQLILLQADKLGGITIPNTFSEAIRNETIDIIRSAFISGYRLAIAICAILALGGALASLALIHNEPNKIGGKQ